MVYFWRFYAGRPGTSSKPLTFADCDPRIVVPAVVYLAAKTEDSWVKAQYVAEKLPKLDGRFGQPSMTTNKGAKRMGVTARSKSLEVRFRLSCPSRPQRNKRTNYLACLFSDPRI